MDEYGFGSDYRQNSPFRQGLIPALVGVGVMIVAALVATFYYEVLLVIYPLQLIMYVLVGRFSSLRAVKEDPDGGILQTVDISAVGGTGALIMWALTWLFYGALLLAAYYVNIGLNVVLGLFGLGFWGWLICVLVDLPISIGLGVLGGKTVEAKWP